MRRSLLALIVIALAACGGTQAAAKPMLLAYKYDPGSRVYTFEMKMNATEKVGGRTIPLNQDMKARETYDVVKRAADGSATIRITVTVTHMTMNGQAMPIKTTKPMSYTVRIGKDGVVLSSAGGSQVNLGGFSVPGSDQMSSFLPDHKVKPGDHWDTTQNRPNPFGSGVMRVTAHSTLLRYDTLKGAQVAVVESKVDMPENFSIDLAKMAALAGPSAAGAHMSGVITYTGKMSLDILTWLDTAAGRLDKMSNSMKMDVTMTMPPAAFGQGASGPIHMVGTSTVDLTAS